MADMPRHSTDECAQSQLRFNNFARTHRASQITMTLAQNPRPCTHRLLSNVCIQVVRQAAASRVLEQAELARILKGTFEKQPASFKLPPLFTGSPASKQPPTCKVCT